MGLSVILLLGILLFSTSRAESDEVANIQQHWSRRPPCRRLELSELTDGGVDQQPPSCWHAVPESCEINYVSDYLLMKQYRRDCDLVADAAIEYAESVEPAADGKDVWVFGIDETMLSNFPYYARYDVEFGAFPYNCTRFYEWVAQGIAPPVPGVRRLYKRLLSLGFKTVILTDTSETYRDARIANLNHAGYYNWDKLFLKSKGERGISSVKYKSKKRTEVVKEGYRIVGNVGDQWSDLIGTNAGNRTFKLPDLMYYVG